MPYCKAFSYFYYEEFLMKKLLSIALAAPIAFTVLFLAGCETEPPLPGNETGHVHQWGEWLETTRATCTTPGVETRVCALDPTHKETCALIIDPEAHDYVLENGTAPTCTEDGNGTGSCRYNPAHKVIGAIPALGHDWGDWEEKTPPTCAAAGIHGHTCKRDPSHIETESIPALGHDYNWVVQDATCTEDGLEFGTCDHCNSFDTQLIPKLGHDWGDWEPLEGNPSKEIRICNRDPSHTETRNAGVSAFDNITDLVAYLNAQEANTRDMPYPIILNVSSAAGIKNAIQGTGRFVELDLSNSTMSNIPDESFISCTVLVSITLPATISRVGEDAFASCNNLISVTFLIDGIIMGPSCFPGNLRVVYPAEGAGTYTRPVDSGNMATWTKQ